MPSGKKEPDHWLCLEPYVHLSLNGETVLFYNALSGERIEIQRSGSIFRITEELARKENGYVVGLTADDLDDKEVRRLVENLRKTFMGELFNKAWSSGKPVNLYPDPHFKSFLSDEMVNNPLSRDLIDYDNYIHEAVIYLNSRYLENDPLAAAYRQFVFPGPSLPGPVELPIDLLEKFFRSVAYYKLTSVSITGSDILNYPHFKDFKEILNKSGFPVTWHLRGDRQLQVSMASLLEHPQSRLAYHVSFPLDADLFNAVLSELIEHDLVDRTEFRFVITTSEELEAARGIIAGTGLPNTSLSPFYNGMNGGFFRDMIFITREDIASSTPSQDQVFSRLSVNEADFGKFTILPDGSVYANINDPGLGNLRNDKIEELIIKELLHGNSWSRIRKSVLPCSGCLYHFLCPPVSSYELVMQRFNFCDVIE